MKLKYGVGIYDGVRETNTKCYQVWNSMLSRCYNQHNKDHQKTYYNCSVCEEWLLFSNFKKWFDEFYIDGYSLDKDLLLKHNRTYSPETCCFLPSEINTALITKQNKKSNLPTGVSKDKQRTFQVHIKKYGKQKRIGTRYFTLSSAVNAYKEAKEKYIKELAFYYYTNNKISKNIFEALNKYEVITESYDEICITKIETITKKVLQINPLTKKVIKIYNSAKEAAKILYPETKYAYKGIQKCCLNKINTYKNYIWKYYE